MSELNGEPPEKLDQGTLHQAARAETVPTSTRRYRAILFRIGLFLAVCVFALLTFLVQIADSLPIDLQITLAIQSIDAPFFEEFMRLVSWPGYLHQSWIITAFIAFLFYLYGFHWESVVCLLTATVSGLINVLVKNLIQRPRPAIDLVDVFSMLDSYSFPSGHVMFYTTLFGFTWYLVYTLLKRSLLQKILLWSLGGVILLVGMSRIYLGQHWASDVLGAYLLGGLILSGTIFFYQWGKTRFFIRQPVAPPESDQEE